MSVSRGLPVGASRPTGLGRAVRTVAVIARATVLEQANRRLLWWLSGVALALVVGLAMLAVLAPFRHSVIAGELGSRELARLFARGVAGIYTLAAVVILGMGVIGHDLESGAVVLFVTRPVSRGQYLVGRYLGNAVTLALTIAVMGLGAFAVVLASGKADLTLLYEFVVLAWNAAVVLAVMVLVNTLAGMVATAIVGFLTWEVVGNVYLASAVVKAGVVSGLAARLLTLFVLLAPHVLDSPLVAGTTTPLGDSTVTLPGPTLPDLVWSAAWIVGALALATLAFRRREL